MCSPLCLAWFCLFLFFCFTLQHVVDSQHRLKEAVGQWESGLAATQTGDWATAATAFSGLLAQGLRPASIVCAHAEAQLATGALRGAQARYEELLQLWPHERHAAVHVRLARVHAAAHDPDAVQRSLQAALDADPDNSEAHYAMAQLLLEEAAEEQDGDGSSAGGGGGGGDPVVQARHHSQGIGEEEDSAVVSAARQRRSEGMAHLEAAARLSTDAAGVSADKVGAPYVALQSELGAALAAAGRFGEAADHWQAAVNASSDSAVAHHQLGVVLAVLGEQRGGSELLAQGADHLRTAQRLSSTATTIPPGLVAYDLALTLARTGQPDMALEQLLGTATSASSGAMAAPLHAMAAALLQHSKRPTVEAVPHLRQVLQALQALQGRATPALLPATVEACVALAEAVHAPNRSEASTLLQQVVDMARNHKPQQADLLQAQGDALLRRGAVEVAAALYDAWQRADPASVAAHRGAAESALFAVRAGMHAPLRPRTASMQQLRELASDASATSAALVHLGTAVGLAGDDDPRAHAALAALREVGGDFRKCAGHWSAVARAVPLSSTAYRRKGVCLAYDAGVLPDSASGTAVVPHEGGLAAAVTALERAMDLEPGCTSCHTDAAWLNVRLWRLDDAYDLLRAAVLLEGPATPPALRCLLADVHARGGHMALARAEYVQCLLPASTEAAAPPDATEAVEELLRHGLDLASLATRLAPPGTQPLPSDHHVAATALGNLAATLHSPRAPAKGVEGTAQKARRDRGNEAARQLLEALAQVKQEVGDLNDVIEGNLQRLAETGAGNADEPWCNHTRAQGWVDATRCRAVTNTLTLRLVEVFAPARTRMVLPARLAQLDQGTFTRAATASLAATASATGLGHLLPLSVESAAEQAVVVAHAALLAVAASWRLDHGTKSWPLALTAAPVSVVSPSRPWLALLPAAVHMRPGAEASVTGAARVELSVGLGSDESRRGGAAAAGSRSSPTPSPHQPLPSAAEVAAALSQCKFNDLSCDEELGCLRLLFQETLRTSADLGTIVVSCLHKGDVMFGVANYTGAAICYEAAAAAAQQAERVAHDEVAAVVAEGGTAPAGLRSVLAVRTADGNGGAGAGAGAGAEGSSFSATKSKTKKPAEVASPVVEAVYLEGDNDVAAAPPPPRQEWSSVAASALLRLSAALSAGGHLSAALTAASTAAKLAVTGGRTHLAAQLAAAVAAGRLGDAGRSVEWLRSAVGSHPRSFAAHARLGVVLAARGHLRAATKHLELAVALRPSSVQVRHLLACTLQRAHRLPLALTHFSKAVGWNAAPVVSVRAGGGHTTAAGVLLPIGGPEEESDDIVACAAYDIEGTASAAASSFSSGSNHTAELVANAVGGAAYAALERCAVNGTIFGAVVPVWARCVPSVAGATDPSQENWGASHHTQGRGDDDGTPGEVRIQRISSWTLRTQAATSALLADFGHALELTGRRRDALEQYTVAATGTSAEEPSAEQLVCGAAEGRAGLFRALRLLLRRGDSRTAIAVLHHLREHRCLEEQAPMRWMADLWLADSVWSLNSSVGALDTAVAGWQAALTLVPGDAATHIKLAVGLAATGRPTAALAHTQTASKLFEHSIGAASPSSSPVPRGVLVFSRHQLMQLRRMAEGEPHQLFWGLSDGCSDGGSSNPPSTPTQSEIAFVSGGSASSGDGCASEAAPGADDVAWVAELQRRLQREHEEWAQATRMIKSAASLAREGRQLEAADVARASVQRAPAAARSRVLHRLGVAAARDGRLEAAKQHFRAALRESPPLLAAQLELAQVLALRGRAAGAAKVYQDVLMRTTGAPLRTEATLASVLTGHASTTLTRAPPPPVGAAPHPPFGSPPPPPPPGGGTSHYRKQQVLAASRVVPLSPAGQLTRARAHCCLAVLHIHGGAVDEGLAEFQRAAEERTPEPAMYVEIAAALARGVAEYWASNSLDLSPRLCPVPDGSSSSSSEHSGSQVHSPAAASHVAHANVRRAVWYLDQALQQHRQGGAAAATVVAVLCRMGWLQLGLGQYEEAGDAFTEAAVLATTASLPDVYVEAHAGLARALAWTGHRQAAQAEYEDAVVACGLEAGAAAHGASRSAAGGDGGGGGTAAAKVNWRTMSLLGMQLHAEGMYNESSAVLLGAVSACLASDKAHSGGEGDDVNGDGDGSANVGSDDGVPVVLGESAAAAEPTVMFARAAPHEHLQSCYHSRMALGGALYAAGRLPDAADVYDKVMRTYRAPEHTAAAANNLGVCLLRQQRPKRALATLQQSLQLRFSAPAAANAALGLVQLNRPAESLSHILAAICALAEDTCAFLTRARARGESEASVEPSGGATVGKPDSGAPQERCQCDYWGSATGLAAQLFVHKGTVLRAMGRMDGAAASLGQSVLIVDKVCVGVCFCLECNKVALLWLNERGSLLLLLLLLLFAAADRGGVCTGKHFHTSARPLSPR